MKINFKDAEQFLSAYKELEHESFSFGTVYKLSKLNSALTEEYKFYLENLQKILSECAEIDETGNFKAGEQGESILLKPDKVEECNQRITELSNVEIDAPDILFDINDFNGIKITPMQINGFMPFIDKNSL